MTSILYNNMNCPFCARARAALFHANINYKIIEVDFNNKPDNLLKLSPKGTVPVFVTSDNIIIDESIEIVRYCVANSKIDQWCNLSNNEEETYLNDFQNNFLNPYRAYRNNSEDENSSFVMNEYLNKLNTILQDNSFISGNKISMVDVMIAPFIGRFILSQKNNNEFQNIINWLNNTLQN